MSLVETKTKVKINLKKNLKKLFEKKNKNKKFGDPKFFDGGRGLLKMDPPMHRPAPKKSSGGNFGKNILDFGGGNWAQRRSNSLESERRSRASQAKRRESREDSPETRDNS
jgi:hypothetical protein